MIRSVLLTALILPSALSAQEAPPAEPVASAPATAVEAPTAPEETAATTPEARGKIVLYRQGAMMGLALGCPIRYKERELVELGRNKYAELEVKPGKYVLTNKTISVQVDVDAGETQYVRCTIKMGMLTGRADLQYADKESFDKQAHEFEKKEPNFIPE
ncbi:MAG: hypothetical protein B7Y36_18770 [Novosphingobium sp. 28-62-57]|uniref:DUF2846 domain-containing protein n=1 Tax=Novosphingobium sp. 28-62-57 TaxID=1970409 RepID=UPI000BCC4FD2|nr:DUF2846 domain-containing protein [Novosphingobium sp. 28-62-57]OYZ07834.1 MAG: hypothetical protein B7Y36_18770 [Novosphingobium sp. 28-62-57]OZA36628.1 MAG: hypothetical protein B7X92_05825 [Novosphingobium sp. 17-62-9]